MQLTRRNILKGAGALGTAGLLASTTVTPALAYTANPSGGSGGPMGDGDAQSYTDPRGVTSLYHRRAAHLAGKSGPYPMVIHLHGDGGYEYRYPNTWTSPQYAQVAKSINGLFFLPRTPQTSNGYTWWQSYSSTQWLDGFIGWACWRYNVDKNRIFISGFSGGAQIASHNLVADFHHRFTGGGAMMLGGGGIAGMSITGTPSAAVKSNFLMQWHVGANDTAANSPEGFDAVQASKIGYDTYTRAGWKTKRVLIPGENHDQSEDNGPGALRSLVNDSQRLYGLPLI